MELQDPGAHELYASGDDEHFSDASEGHKRSSSRAPSPLSSRQASPVPRTRVERVDDKPSHGEVPGSSAYEMRTQDAVPDELEIVPEGGSRRRSSSSNLHPTLNPGGTQIPLTVVEKVDPTSPSHGEVPGTAAYEKRQADAAPDLVVKASESQKVPKLVSPQPLANAAISQPIPKTIITRADSTPGPDEERKTAVESLRSVDKMPSGEGHAQPTVGKQMTS